MIPNASASIRLGFPNKEVEEGFTEYLLPFYTNIRQGESAFFIGNFVRDLERWAMWMISCFG
jgi:hypothetical protein